MTNFVWPLLVCAAVMSIAMLLAWLWQLRSGNAGIVDVIWTFGVGFVSVGLLTIAADGSTSRRALLAALIGFWSLRLGIHLLVRVLGHKEDKRYSQLKEKWGDWAQPRLLLFYQSQAIATPLFAFPLLLAGKASEPLNGLDVLGVLIWFIAIGGEWQADRQLKQFRADPENRDKVCQRGWWEYSRHPNYFFEWLHWCSYIPFAVNASWGWLSILTPALMLYFLCFVTGIPPAEAQSLASRGAAYRDYQRRTSPFVPWPPREK